MNRHTQMHQTSRMSFPKLSESSIKLLYPLTNKEDEVNRNVVVDQFFAEEHNLVNGFVSTSPAMYDNPMAASHMQVFPAERGLPAGLSDEEIHSMVVPRSLQSPAELNMLRQLRPDPANFKEPDTPVTLDPDPAAASDPASASE